ncbi:MAG: hypothetical protein M3O30_03540 [Planctomycetota bacterium]|nr:hypothetical protein [Planctomycetota bacterium]
MTEMVGAHGIVGNRFFPPTATTDDPFAADELALPTLSIFANPGGDNGPSSREIDTGFEFDKLLFPKFSLGVSDQFISVKTPGQGTSSGFGDVVMIAKYIMWENVKHEWILSVGGQVQIGGTGNPRFANSFTTFTPMVYFGKGLGDLPDSVDFLKPFALTGQVGLSLPTSTANPNTLPWGLALEYSLPYLQQHVKDVGLPAPFKNMIPLVEFSMNTGLNRGADGHTTGTINPGVLWEAPDFQLGVEALIPINGQTGPHVGAVLQLQLFIDDLFPKIFGHPIFGI